MHNLILVLLVSISTVVASVDGPPRLGKEVPDFALLDYKGRQHQLTRTEAPVIVLYFTANGCPIARQNLRDLRSLQNEFVEQGVRFWLVNANTADDRASIEKESQEFRAGWIPVLIDESQGVAAMLGVKRTGTAVAIDAKTRKVFYQGAVDDRLVEGAQKPKATKTYLKDALTEFLAGKEVEVSTTAAHGCLVGLTPKESLSYSKDIAPLLQQKCFGCHSPGNIGPIKFTSHQKVSGNADMIQEVLLSRRMPPWQADRHHGSFSNDSSLSPEEARRLLRWIEAGAPRGDGADPLESASIPESGWALGQPDVILALPKVEEIPATGVLDYRHIKVATPFTEDAWIKGVVVKPDNKRVVHHIIVRVREPGQKGDNPDDAFLTGWAPGTPELYFPEGTGKLIKKGSLLDFEMHYTTSGREEKDQSQIGLYLHQSPPPITLKTHAAYNLEFEIPPGDAHADFSATYAFKKDGILYDMSPHMHMRGQWFKFEALYPNGDKELLLSVPEYDFKWQHSYRLASPKRMPAGTWILCSGGFDNSARKPGNPNPRVPLHFGEQSFDEMFIGFMSVAEAPANDAKPLAGK